MQVKVGLQQTLLELLSSSSAPRRRSWGTGGREATTGAPLEADTAPGVIITTMKMITTNIIMLMTSILTITMMMIVIEQTWERGTEFLSTSLLPPVLQIVKLVHVRGEKIAVVRKEL